jgi:signal transduction histidine kinase
MRIRLISGDQFLCKLCREVLLGFRDREWDFGMIASYEQARWADLFIWDLHPETQLPQNSDFDPRRRNIFLIARKHVGTLQRRLPLRGCSIVLKPVNSILLRALLEEAVANHEQGSRTREGQLAEQFRLERDEMLQYLLQANLKLQEYDQDRTNFLAHSVHDIRAPLMAIQGYCGLLLENQLGPLNAEQMKVLERMQRSIKRLSRLTSGMFQISVDRQSPRRSLCKNGDIEACITQAVHEVAPVVQSKHIDLRVQSDPPVETLLFDDMQIEQVLVNLLDNACRFTPRNGTIEIRAYSTFWDRRFPNVTEGVEHADRRGSTSRNPNAYRVEVRDSGRGVPAGDLERIFEEYTSDAESSEWSRAGLGLAICRQIIHAHHGVVFAESGEQGAIFVFMLPYEEALNVQQQDTNISATTMAAAGAAE